MYKFGHCAFACSSRLLNRDARKRQSPLPVGENFTLIHNTGKFLLRDITWLITHVGYQVSGLEIMSFVPSAITSAVVSVVIFLLRMVKDDDALRPVRASTVTEVQVLRAVILSLIWPNADVPTVKLSPTNRTFPWPSSFTAVLRTAGTELLA